MDLTAAPATERHWCNFCPDLILPGEVDATGDGFLNPLGEPGHAHADCAVREGYEVTGDVVPAPDDFDAVQRHAFRARWVATDALPGEVAR